MMTLAAVAAAATQSGCAARRDGGEADAASRRLEVVERLLVQTEPNGDEVGYFVLDLDEGELRQLESDAGAGDRALLSDPAAAARAFGRALGMPADTRYELLELSNQPEEGPGAFLAVFRASNSGGALRLRLMSQPGSDGRPTFWVINDVERLAPAKPSRK